MGPLAATSASKEVERSLHDLRLRLKELRDAVQLLGARTVADHRLIERVDGLAASLGEIRDLTKVRELIDGPLPVLTGLIESRIARAADQWQARRAEWLGDPPRPEELPRSEPAMTSIANA
jgi:CHAD domain-containing protein